MLLNIDPVLGPELLRVLRAMGHGDELAIVDANFPAASHSQNVLRYDGISATKILDAVMSVLPLDSYVDYPVQTMQVVNAPNETPQIVDEFIKIIKNANNVSVKFKSIERCEFYSRVKNVFCVVVSGENRLYGNIILKKGVIK